MTVQRDYTFRARIRVVGQLLKEAEGRLLDVGARDRSLGKELDLKRVQYFSADLSDGHDYQLNLEKPLDIPDRSFDYVVALDVLEHVENIHQAFKELSRITKKSLIIALPNMATLPRRISFLFRGDVSTQKYDLLPEHQGDRHRWFTVYSQINRFIEDNAKTCGLTLEKVVEEMDGGSALRVLGVGMARLGVPTRGLLTGRCIYVLKPNN